LGSDGLAKCEKRLQNVFFFYNTEKNPNEFKKGGGKREVPRELKKGRKKGRFLDAREVPAV
jgi:hypothetical protein